MQQLIGLFTTSSEIIEEGQAYLGILKWTFVLFLISNLLISMLRSVETVRISFIISVVSLLANGGINYTLIFGHFGFPEMGIRGNSHMLMMEYNNFEIADLLQNWLIGHGLTVI